MKDTCLTKATEKAIDIMMKATDDMIAKYIEPLTEFGSPEKMIGVAYADWTPEDLTKLVGIYGDKPDSVLSNFIAKKEIAKMDELAKQVAELEGEGNG